MALHLIHGPPNSGRAGLVRQRLLDALERDPVLVVPTLDDVYGFERELCEARAILGATVTTFGGLFRIVATAAGAPPVGELSPAQRLGAVAAAVAEQRDRLGPLRASSLRPGFADALESLLGELQAAGLEPDDVESAAATLEGSAYMGDIGALFDGYARVRDRLGRVDTHGIARDAIRLLGDSGGFWRGRPVLLYGFDDLTGNELDLVRALREVTDVTVALPYEEDNAALAARSSLLEGLRSIGVDSVTETRPQPENTESALLFSLERGFGAADASPHAPDGCLTFLRSAGERGEAEAVAAEAAKLLAAGTHPEEIAIVARDPARRGPLIASVLESYGIHTALEAEVGVATTAVGGALIALLDAELGDGGATSLLRYMRGPSGLGGDRVDWFERALRRGRVQSARGALRIWEQRHGELPGDLAALREAADDPSELARAVAKVAEAMLARTLSRSEGTAMEADLEAELEGRAAGAISTALEERAELALQPDPGALAHALSAFSVRAWAGPATGRIRIADPYRLRAARFDHVFVVSLQDGEFPRLEGRADPFLSERQRESLGLQPRRETDAEERYLFHACLALPRRQLFLSYRDCDEAGAAEARSPFLDGVRKLLDPPPDPEAETDSVERELTRARDLAQVVHRVAEAPSEDELARAIATRSSTAEAAQPLAIAAAPDAVAARVCARLEAARAAEAAGRAPGPLSNPAVIERLAAVPAYGGTTLEGFDVCSYMWFVSHELSPERLDPIPDPLVQGGLMHEALERLYGEPPGPEPVPRPASVGDWVERGRELVTEIAAERELGKHPAERAIVRRVDGLLTRFLLDEAERDTAGFRPWLLEAKFDEGEDADRPVLRIGDWALHGAIDRVDRAPDGRAVVIDYKLSSSVTSCDKLEEKAKLQLQLYLIAVADLWEGEAVAGLYHPLRGTRSRRPRGIVLEEAAEDLASYDLYGRDQVDRPRFEELLDDARRRSTEIVARMRVGDIDRDPGPREGLRGHDLCPQYCEFAPICRRDRAPAEPDAEEEDER